MPPEFRKGWRRCLRWRTETVIQRPGPGLISTSIVPIAIGLAQSLGYDPRPLVIAVMLAASLAFSTPIGYQTNMLVYGPGGYKFTDFMRVGIPLNLSTGIIASLLIPFFWPL